MAKHLPLPISTGIYRTRSSQHVHIFEIGTFAYGRNPSGAADFWYPDNGTYGGKRTPHPMDLVERIPQIGDEA